MQKKKPLLFLLSDILTGPSGCPKAVSTQHAEAGPTPPLGTGMVNSMAEGRSRVVPRGDGNPTTVSGAGTTDFARAFDAAFEQLDRARGSHNFVNLVDLRRAFPVDRQTFEAELRQLRLARRYTLSAAEDPRGISPEEQDAGIPEDGALLLFVSRKLS
jgi:hypothetical protein